ncbi:hypothetical protein SH601_05500 [Gracilibacillus sp. S3-1-1]|uniref:Uncharacterized protein n=1 Tax=Gracilibacillus pellucidus TaxID=3095368 RepID=A0ACC6M3J3_9BACI|nr:hypothetical protein [Gracilibacillus sp. S3-1-1]MDX8045440.1 hypothetical protein [Gracilibacillus sp. S3-1-1]
MKDKRINRPQHIKTLMQEQINILRRDDGLDPIDKARAIAYLSNIALTAIKDGDFDERLKAIESQLEGDG